MASEYTVGKVTIKVYPDTKTFGRELNAYLRRKERDTELKVNLEPREEGFAMEVRREVRKAERRAGKIEIPVDLDYDHLTRQLKRVNDRLTEMSRVKLTYDADKKGLEKARKDLENLRDASRLHLKIVEDREGLTEARNRIAAILRDRQAVTIDVRTDDESLRREMARLDKLIEKATPTRRLSLETEVDQDSLKRNLRAVDRAIAEMDTPKIEVEYDRESLLAARRRIQDEIAGRPIEIEYHADEEGYRAALKRINEMVRDQERKMTMEVDNDPVALRKARHQLQEIVDDYDNKRIEFKAQTDAFLARRELQYTARTRFVTLVVNVSKASVARAEATLRALSGLRFLERGLRRIWDSFKNIDKNIVIIGTIAQAVAGLTAWLLAASSNTFSLARGLAQIFGLGLLLPGILGGFAAGIGATVAVLRDMLIIVPELSNMFHALQDRMSFEFWGRFEQPFRRMIDVIFPEFSTGMRTTSMALGVYFSNIADAARRQLSGKMAPMFVRLAESIVISAQGADTFLSIIEILGRRGSDVLPRLARWWNDVTGNFDRWLKSTERSGRLDEIIETAIQNARDLGWVLYHTGGMLAGLARAAEKAGGSTLESLARKMERIHRAVDRPLFQQGLTRALEAAHDAMHRIAYQSGPRVTAFFKNLSHLVDRGFRDVGDTIGLLIGGLAESFSTPRFSGGLLDFLRGLREMAESLGRAWGPLGDGLGALGEVAGTFARQFGPLLAEMFIQLSDLLQTLAPYLKDWITTLSDRLLPLTQIVGPIIITMAEAFAKVVTPLIELPGLAEAFMATMVVSKLLGFAGGLTGIAAAMGPLRTLFTNTATATTTFWRSLRPFQRTGMLFGMAGAITAIGVALSHAWLTRNAETSALATEYDRLAVAMLEFAENMTRTGEITAGFAGNIQEVADRLPAAEMERFFGELTSKGSDLTGVDAAVRNLAFSLGDLEHGMGVLKRTWSMLTLQQGKFGPLEKEMEAATQAVSNFDQGLADLLQEGHFEAAAALAGEFAASAERQGLSAQWAAEQLPKYQRQLELLGPEYEYLNDVTDATHEATQKVNQAFQELGFGTPALVQAIQDGAQGFFDISQAVSEVDEKMAELEKSASASDYAEALEAQVAAQRDWADNMTTLAKKGVDEGVLTELARLGPEAAPLVAAMVSGTQEEIERIEQAIKDGMVGPIGATEGEFAKMVQAAKDGLSEISPETRRILEQMEPELVAQMGLSGIALMEGLTTGIGVGSHVPMTAMREAAANVGRGFTDVMRIESPSKVFMEYGGFLMTGLALGISGGWPSVGTALLDIASGVVDFFSTAPTWLVGSGHGLVGGLIDGIRNRFGDADVTSKGLGDTIRKPFDPAATWLGGKGGDFVSGLVGGINRSKADAGTASTDVTKAVRTPFNPAGTWLPGRGSEAVRGLARGLSGALHMVRTAVTAIRLALVNAFSSAGSWLAAAGGRSIAGLANGIRGALHLIRSASAGARGAVVGAFGGAGGWLVGAGRRIMAGLASGISSRVGAIRAQLNSLTKAIPSWKGPASTDSRLLFNAGQLIIGGLIDGLESQYKGVYASLKGLSRGIEGVQIGGPNVGMSYAPQGALRGAQAHLASREGMAYGGGDHIEFHGNVGMDPEDVAAAIEWRKRRQAMRMGMGAIARGV